MSDVEVAGNVSAEQLASVYNKIREAREELSERFKEEDSVLKKQLEMVEGEILTLCKELGAGSIRTSCGTIIRRVASRYWTNDWDSMYAFIQENDAFPLLEQRIHQGHMKQFLEENPDKLPAGLQADSKYTVVVRRTKA